MASQELLATLARLEGQLAAVGSRLTAEARPPATVIEGFAALVAEARGVLAAADDGPGLDDPAGRLAVLRAAAQVKRRLQVVARLVAGSAWYAALAKELEGDTLVRDKRTYGRQGASAVSPAPSSIERRA